jgi:parallel beta-helix repeat protein
MKMRRSSKFACVVSLALLLAIAPGGAPTRAAQPGDLHFHLGPSAPCEVAGLIGTNTTWSPGTCDPYIVTGNVSVQSGATLTIQPGTTVKFDSLKALAVAGTLVACGTEGNPITFTSNRPSPAKGDWAYIYFANSSTDASLDRDCSGHGSGSIIQHAVIEYAGGASVGDNGALRIESSSPIIDHNTIQDSNSNGIRLWDSGAAPRITNNTISGNSGNGIVAGNFINSGTTISGNTVTGNTGRGIYVDDRAIVSGNVITGNTGGGIYVDSNATISGNTISNNSASTGGGIYAGGYGSAPAISGNVIVNNTASLTNIGGGIYIANNSNPAINNNDLYGNMSGNPANVPNDLYNGNEYGQPDVNAENNDWGTTDPAVIEGHIWHFMDDPWLGIVSYDSFPTPGVPCTALGLITTNTTWSPGTCDPYIVTGNVSVQPGATLTIQPGTTVKFDSLKALAVAGTLVACGTEGNPITFTSNQSSPAKGDWAYIHFANSSADASLDRDCSGHGSGSIIQYAVIEYAGGASVGDNGALRIESSSPIIDHNTIQDNNSNGICLWDSGAAPRITNNTISGNSGNGIVAGTFVNSKATISGNTVTGHSGRGIYLDEGVTINDNVVTGNSGGGIYVDSSATIRGNTISNNSASTGGGIYAGGYGSAPAISGNVIVNNTASLTNIGGGIYVADDSNPIINNNDLYGNMSGNPANVPNDLYNGNEYGQPDVNAENNYWGTTDSAVIEDHVWHFLDNSTLGIVDYIPFRSSSIVTTTPILTPTLYAISNPDGDGNYTVDWSDVTGALTYTLHEDDNAGFTSPTTRYAGSASQYAISGQPAGTWYYRVKAANASGESGWSNVQSTTVNPSSPVARVTVSGPTTGTVNAPYVFIATVSPLTATQPITYVWQASGQSPVTYVDGLSSTDTFTWSTTGTQVITVTASNVCGSAKANHTITILVPDTGADAYEQDDVCAQASLLTTDGTVQQHTFHDSADEDWAHFTVTSGITYVLQAASTSPGADLVLELYDACGGNLEGTDDAFGNDARLIFTAPSDGEYYVRTLNHEPTVYGPGVTYELSVRLQSSDGVVLIVAGHDDNYRLQDNILHCANTAFRTFLRGGLTRANLRYLSDVDDDARTDADGDGVSDVDDDSAPANVQAAITTWAASLADADTPFYLYLVDHGTVNAFLADGNSRTITPTVLSGWLTALETNGAPVSVVYEACHSGSFIDGLKKQGRVVIASTGRLNNAYPSYRGALFSDAFFTQLGQCSDLHASFRAAKAAVGATGLWQTPWLEDNADGTPDDGDGAVARQRGLPLCGFVDRPPVIDRVTPPVSIVNGDGVLRTQVRDDDDEGLEVWAVVYPPSFEEPPPTADGTMPDLGLPRVSLSDSDGDGEYVGLYEDFTEDGVYHVVVYAQDSAGNHALPAMATVQTRWWVFLPAVVRNWSTR